MPQVANVREMQSMRGKVATPVALRSVALVAVTMGALTLSPSLSEAQGGGVVVRATVTGSDSNRARVSTSGEMFTVLDQARNIRLISQELERFLRLIETDSVARSRPELFARLHAPTLMSLQRHASDAVFSIQRICMGGTPRRAWLGVEIEEFDVRFARPGGVELPYPTIVRVEPASPASEARLASGDVIKLVNGADPRGKPFQLFVTRPGDTLELAVSNAGTERKVRVALSAPPSSMLVTPMACEMVLDSREIGTLLLRDSAAANALKIPAINLHGDSGAIVQLRMRGQSNPTSGAGVVTFIGSTGPGGLRVTLVRSFFGAQFWSASQEHLAREGASEGGVPVLNVVADSPAARAGLQIGDIVTRFDKTPVKSMADLSKAIDAAARNEVFELEVLRERKVVRVNINR